MASRYSAQHPSRGAVTGLSYPSTPGFPRCRLRQVSPCSPRTSPCAQKPSCAVPVALLRYAPGVGMVTDFHRVTGHQAIACLTPFPCRPTSCRCGTGWIGSKEGVAPSSALRSRTSPSRGMRLQRLLDSRLAAWNLPGWRPDMPFRACVFAVWRPARWVLCVRGFTGQAAALASQPGFRRGNGLANTSVHAPV